jgi:hypothetical protein
VYLTTFRRRPTKWGNSPYIFLEPMTISGSIKEGEIMWPHYVFFFFFKDHLSKSDSNGRLAGNYIVWQTWWLTLQLSVFFFLCSNIPFLPAYCVHIFQLIRYARACFTYENFSKQGQLLTKKLMLQGYNKSLIKSSFHKEAVCNYKLSLAHWFVLYPLLDFPYWLWRWGNSVYLILTRCGWQVSQTFGTWGI